MQRGKTTKRQQRGGSHINEHQALTPKDEAPLGSNSEYPNVYITHTEDQQAWEKHLEKRYLSASRPLEELQRWKAHSQQWRERTRAKWTLREENLAKIEAIRRGQKGWMELIPAPKIRAPEEVPNPKAHSEQSKADALEEVVAKTEGRTPRKARRAGEQSRARRAAARAEREFEKLAVFASEATGLEIVERVEKIAKEQISLIKEISAHIEGINSNVDAMIEERKKANNLNSADKTAVLIVTGKQIGRAHV